MSSGHGHGAAEVQGARPDGSRGALAIALALTGGFMVVEAVVGYWSGSLALMADAGHMLGDSGALIMSLLIAQVALRPRSRQHTFGYRRAEVMGALANAAALFAVSVFIVVEAVGRLSEPPEVRGVGMLITAGIGLLVNIVSAWVLHRRGGSNINVRSALFHVLSDALGSAAAIIAGTLLLTLGLRIADPIASMVISVLIFLGALRLLRETTHVLMEGSPQGIDVAQVERTIASTMGVAGVHDLHVWSLTPGVPMLTAHVIVGSGFHGIEVARAVGERLQQGHGIHHVTIQPEAPAHVVVPLRLSRDEPMS